MDMFHIKQRRAIAMPFDPYRGHLLDPLLHDLHDTLGDDTAQSEFRGEEGPLEGKLVKLLYVQTILIHMCEKYLKYPHMKSKSIRINYIL